MGSSVSDKSEPDPIVTQFRAKELEKLRGARILIADDHQVNQQITRLMVERLGHKADTVGNGIEALHALNQIPYDLILMDCQMPEMDGYEATRAIRKSEREKLEAANEKREELGVRSKAQEQESSDTPDSLLLTSHFLLSPSHFHVPIIALTANAMQGDKEKCLQAGMDDYLSKPVRPEELTRILTIWLPQRTNPTSKLQAPLQEPTVAPASPQQLEHSSVNTQTLKELEELGGPEFLQKVIHNFVEDALQCVTVIEQSLDAQDLDQTQKSAHGLKGIALNIGADSLAHAALNLESACKNGESASLLSFRKTIQDSFQQTRRDLEDTIKNA